MIPPLSVDVQTKERGPRAIHAVKHTAYTTRGRELIFEVNYPRILKVSAFGHLSAYDDL